MTERIERGTVRRGAVLGKPIRHSLSPNLFNLFWQTSNQPNGQYLRMHTDNMKLALESCRILDIQFASVTHPLKQAALEASGSVSPTARKLGAANSLRLQEDGHWHGDNTDPDGVHFALEQINRSQPMSDRTVLIFGAGGAANAAAYACLERHIPVSIACRSTGKLSHELAGDDRLTIMDMKDAQDHASDFDVIIWTIPDYPAQLALTGLQDCQHVLDARYGFQRPSGFFGRATVLDGLSWLVGQGAAFFRQLYPEPGGLDEDQLDRVQDRLRECRSSTPAAAPRHIALIGFMGAGKSTVGKIVAEKTGLSFADTDAIIERRTGMQISRIFSTRGEAGFRNLERAVLAELHASPHPSVLALGGGATGQPEIQHILQNCLTIWLLRDLDSLQQVDPSNRPLMNRTEPTTLFKSRIPDYSRVAHVVLPVGETPPEEIAREIAGMLQA